MEKAVLSIQVDAQNQVEVRWQGEKPLMLPMIGALDVAKGWLLDTIQTNHNVSASEMQQKWEETLQKWDALWHYLELWAKIESRIQAINKADAQATFIVDTSLFSKI